MSKHSSKTKKESIVAQDESRSSESRMGVEVLKTYTFPEHGVSIRAVDMLSAKKQLEKRLKGGKHV